MAPSPTRWPTDRERHLKYSNGGSYGQDPVEDPKARFGFTYRVLGGVGMSFPPLR